MSWAMLEKLLAEVATHSTLIGKYWFSFLFVFRVIVVLSVGDKVYGDEQSKFICNTLQPGCDNICFNQFSPISHIRFWAMQILLVALPSIIFIVWAMHALNKVKEKKERLEKEEQQRDAATEPMARDPLVLNNNKNMLRTSTPPPKYKLELAPEPKEKSVYVNAEEAKNRRSVTANSKVSSRRVSRSATKPLLTSVASAPPPPPVAEVMPLDVIMPKPDKEEIKMPPVLAGYVLQIIFRMAIEATFVALQYILFQTYVPEMYRCEGYPCPQRVECFISRPMEKNIFLIFMYVISGVCLFMDFMELHYFGFRKVYQLLHKGNKSTRSQQDYLRAFEERWHQDPHLADRFNLAGRGFGLRRHRDMSITDDSGSVYDSVETSDDGDEFE